MQTVQVQLWRATLSSNFPKGSTNIPYGKSPGLFSGSSCVFFFSAVYSMECPMSTSSAEEQNRGLWEEAAHWRAYIPYTSA